MTSNIAISSRRLPSDTLASVLSHNTIEHSWRSVRCVSQPLLAILSLNSPRADAEGPTPVVVSDRRNTARR
jgi:hypothetical protein